VEEEGQLRGARGQSQRRRRSGEGEALRRWVSWEEGNRGRRGELAGFVRAAWRGATGLVFLWIFFSL
jgi:hypothetical protein